MLYCILIQPIDGRLDGITTGISQQQLLSLLQYSPPCDSYNSLSHAGLNGQFPAVLPVGTNVCSSTHVSLNQLPSPARSKYSLQPPVLVLCMLLFRKHAINLDLDSRAVSASSRAEQQVYRLQLLCCPPNIRIPGSLVLCVLTA